MLSIRRVIQISIFDNYFLIIFVCANFPEIDNKLVVSTKYCNSGTGIKIMYV
jgi:hypothetical protein